MVFLLNVFLEEEEEEEKEEKEEADSVSFLLLLLFLLHLPPIHPSWKDPPDTAWREERLIFCHQKEAFQLKKEGEMRGRGRGEKQESCVVDMLR